jgi:HEAT repeat protein
MRTRFSQVEGAFMRSAALSRVSVFVLIASCLLLALAHQQPTTPASPPQTNAPAQQQPTHPSALPPPNAPAQQPTIQPQASEPGQRRTGAHKASQTPKEEAWQILDTACTGDKTSDRATAVRVLGLMPSDAKALKAARKALRDDKPEVRSAAAAALGDMNSRISIPKLSYHPPTSARRLSLR